MPEASSSPSSPSSPSSSPPATNGPAPAQPGSQNSAEQPTASPPMIAPDAMMPAGGANDTSSTQPGEAAPPSDPVTLTVTGNGSGAFGVVTSVANLLTCSTPPCSVRVARGAQVVLRARTGYDGSGFAGWQGPCSGVDECVLTATADLSVIASYEPANVVFVTSTTVAGNFGGPAAGDALCAARAAAAGLAGTYRAWVSNSSVSALDALQGSRGWVRVDGFPVADTVDAMLRAQVFYPIQVDETGTRVDGRNVWTGTGDGGRVGLSTCNDWSSADATVLGTPGRTEFIGANFSTLPAITCNTQAPVYCFGVGRNVIVSPVATEGRRAFSTDDAFQIQGGLATADAFCQSQATSRGLTGSFKAVLNTSRSSAASRFDLSGPPWVRLDGLRITETAREFFEGLAWQTSVNVTPAGFYSSGTSVWAGGSTLTQPGILSNTCDDWTSTAGTASTGLVTGSTPDSHFFFGRQSTPCSQASVLLTCLEE